MRGKRHTVGQKAAATAAIQAGASVREAAAIAGISKSAAAVLASGDDAPKELVEAVKARIQGRLIVASDRFLSHSLDRLQDLHPYQAMLCAGIAHDHYLRSVSASAPGAGLQGLTQILVLIDQRMTTPAPTTTSSGTPPPDADRIR